MNELAPRKIIIYIGGFGLPDYTASGQRALENARLFKSIGYKVILMGKIDFERAGVKSDVRTHYSVEDIDVFDIRWPDDQRKYKSYLHSIDSVQRIFNSCLPGSVHAVVAYNYPVRALVKMIRYFRRYDIKVVAECTEWHGIERKGIVRSIKRFIGTELRMRFVGRRAGNIICASKVAEAHFGHCRTVRIPFVVDISNEKWRSPHRPVGSMPRRFIYAGSPGIGMTKDLLHTVISSFASAKREGHQFELAIVGISREQFLEELPSYAQVLAYLDKEIEFLGRLTHLETLKEICRSDIFVFLRPKNRVSSFGFPTKYVEAHSCGIPTVTNNTSDIGLYLKDGVNGFLLEHSSESECEKALTKSLNLSDDELEQMKENCRRFNPFGYEEFQPSVSSFFESLN